MIKQQWHICLPAAALTSKVKLENNCSDTTVFRTIRVYDKPAGRFTVNAPVVCPGTIAGFTNTSTLANAYEWIWGDNTGSGSAQTGNINTMQPDNIMALLVASLVSNNGFACRIPQAALLPYGIKYMRKLKPIHSKPRTA